MKFRRLRRDCEKRLRHIEIPHPFSIEAFRASLAGQRGRALHLYPLPGSAQGDTPCGAWIATASADHVFYEPATSPLHREHIICHELAHMLCGHRRASDWDHVDVQRLLPHISPTLVQHMLGRTGYSTEHEQEAEMLATVILEEAERTTSSSPATAVSGASPVVTRIEQALTSERGRSRD